MCLFYSSGESKWALSGLRPWKCLSARRHAGQMRFWITVSNHEDLAEEVRMILRNRERNGRSWGPEGLPESA